MENIFIGYYLNRKLKNGKKKTQNFISIVILVSPLVNAKGLIRFISSPTIYVIDAITIIALAYTVVNYLYFILYIKPHINEAKGNGVNQAEKIKETVSNTKSKSINDIETVDFDPSKLIPRKNYSKPDTSEQDKRIEKAKSSVLSKREAMAKRNETLPIENKTEVEPIVKLEEEQAISNIDLLKKNDESSLESNFLTATNERNNGTAEEIKGSGGEDDFVEEEMIFMDFNIPEEEVTGVENKIEEPTLKEKVSEIKAFTQMMNELADAPIFEQTDYSMSLEHFNHPNIENEDKPYDGVLNAVADITDVLEQISISDTEEHLNNEANPTMDDFTESNLIPGESGLFQKKKKKKSIFED